MKVFTPLPFKSDITSEAFSLIVSDTVIIPKTFLEFPINIKVLPSREYLSKSALGISKELPDYVKNTGFDAMITDVPEAVLCTSHADCVPVMLYDSENNAVAAIHSGWRGTVQKISVETVARMSSEYSTDPEFLKAVIGPSIGIDRFETDSDVFEALKNAFTEKFDEYSTKYIYQKNNEEGKLKYYISVSGFVYETLLEAGLKPENIYYDNRCTFENEDLFFSHRRDKGDTGIMAAMISPRR